MPNFQRDQRQLELPPGIVVDVDHPVRGIADIFRFVNEHFQFLSAMKPLQPRYAKKIAD
jgi:hypothetical protein